MYTITKVSDVYQYIHIKYLRKHSLKRKIWLKSQDK